MNIKDNFVSSCRLNSCSKKQGPVRSLINILTNLIRCCRFLWNSKSHNLVKQSVRKMLPTIRMQFVCLSSGSKPRKCVRSQQYNLIPLRCWFIFYSVVTYLYNSVLKVFAKVRLLYSDASWGRGGLNLWCKNKFCNFSHFWTLYISRPWVLQ
jgi:hypothetical protein